MTTAGASGPGGPATAGSAEPASVAGPAAGGGAGRAKWQRVLRALVLLVVLAFFGSVLARRWGEVRPVLGRLSLGTIALSAAAVFAGIFASFLGWRALLADLGSPLKLSSGMRVFFLGQLGKYLPGSVWAFVGPVELARDYAVPRRTAGAAIVVAMGMVLGTGLLVGALSLPMLEPGALGRYWPALAVLPVAAIVLHPRVLNRLLGLVLRLARRDPLPQPLTLGGVGRSFGWCLVMWVLYGVHVWALGRGLGLTSANLFIRSTGAFAVAWCVGFLVVVAPAGAGAREGALAFLLRGAATVAVVAVLAVVSRLLFTLGDLGWTAVAALWAWRDRRAQTLRDARAGT